MTRILAIVQARMGSSRLPGKCLADIAGKPLLQHVIDRARASTHVSDVVVATTCEPADTPLVAHLRSWGVPYFRGSTDDVLDRFYQASSHREADVIVRITADDPLKDPAVVDRVIARFLDASVDYASNTLEPTYPEGLDVEVFTHQALVRAWREASLRSEREHVTPYIWSHPDRFRLLSVTNDRDLSALRFTVDYADDLVFVRAVYAELYRGRVFGLSDVLALLERRPDLLELNRGIPRNEGYLRSLADDEPLS